MSAATPALKPSSAARSAGEHGGGCLSSSPRAASPFAAWPTELDGRATRRMARTRRSLAESCIAQVIFSYDLTRLCTLLLHTVGTMREQEHGSVRTRSGNVGNTSV